MTINFNNVYVKEVSTVAGFDEKKGQLKGLYDMTYDDYYINEKTFEQAEMKMIEDAINIVLNKSKIDKSNIDLIIGADLSNQVVLNTYTALKFNRPYFAVYNACASSCEQIILASSLLQTKKIKNVLINTSSHNMTSERQFRNPVEYGSLRPKRSTFTVTGSASMILTNEKTNIKVTNCSIGTICDMKLTDVNDMGSIMAVSAAKTIYEHLKETNTNENDYDLILTGDLGIYGSSILRDYMNNIYNIKLGDNYIDAASIIYDRTVQKHVNAGGSGPSCLPLVTYSSVIRKLRKKEYKKVLLAATGALMNTMMNNQKFTIPSICHTVCLEAL